MGFFKNVFHKEVLICIYSELLKWCQSFTSRVNIFSGFILLELRLEHSVKILNDTSNQTGHTCVGGSKKRTRSICLVFQAIFILCEKNSKPLSKKADATLRKKTLDTSRI